MAGVGVLTAQVIIAGLGVDMNRFLGHRHTSSWLKLCPGNHDESAGKRRSGRTGKGNQHLRAAQSRSPKPARAHQDHLPARTIRADQASPRHNIARRSDPERLARRLVAHLERLGHKVNLEPAPQAA